MASRNLVTRWALTSSTEGSGSSASLAPVVFSIALSRCRSRGDTNNTAVPERPARPVRPMRCTYDSVSCGMS
ncbi:Uncharacterised protein [Mycobacteroides abscessus subsp. abscessus]|nr:Uncharacterised protein [Mycobacteroides abscessus subsp. abscessus]SKU20582.1 Uncharacterised protein [Mycobacteroides abscessus subsp. abscessus]